MTVNIDSILQVIGEFGPYQKKVYFLLCIPVIFVGAANLAYVFIAAEPNYRCFVDGCDTKETAVYYEPYLNFSIPWDKDHQRYAQCRRYKHESDKGCQDKYFTNKTEACSRDNLVYDNSTYVSTLVTEFNLTCSHSWEAGLAQSIYFGGILFGSFAFGITSDYIGRKLTIMAGFFGMAVTGIGTALVPNLISFHVMRFFNAMSTSAVFQTAFVLGLEMVGPSKRVMCGVIGEYFFALGEVVLALLAWVIRDWRMLQLVLSAPCACFLFYWWVVPESVRWLQSQGRQEDVINILQKVARFNKTNIPVDLLESQPTENLSENDEEVLIRGQTDDVTLWKVLCSPVLCVRFLFMCFIWIQTTLVYYGISTISTDLGTEDNPNKPYLDFMINALVEMPGYTIAWIGMSMLGRKGSLSLSLMSAGAFCIGASLLAEGGSMVVVAVMFGKCGITSAFAIIYLYTSELFPTKVRNTILGSCSMCARIGGMLAPFSKALSDIYVQLPLLVFGTMSILGGMCSLAFPETLNTKLPDTIVEAVSLGRSTGSEVIARNLEEEPLLEEDE
ncbi:organic cation transporter protein-like isoform X2 [Oratosquilla oratoria]